MNDTLSPYAARDVEVTDRLRSVQTKLTPFVETILRMAVAEPHLSECDLRRRFLKPHHRGKARAAYNRPIRMAIRTLYDLRFACEHNGRVLALPLGEAWVAANPPKET